MTFGVLSRDKPQTNILTARDPMLSDREALIEAIYRERYTEEQLTRRIEYRSRRDRPLWNHLRRVEDIDAAE